MNKFSVALTEHAISDLRSIPQETRKQLHQSLRTRESQPFPSGSAIKRLRGFRPPVYRLRSENYRVIYRIQGDSIIILRIIDLKLLKRAIQRLQR